MALEPNFQRRISALKSQIKPWPDPIYSNFRT
jgi:hypothetical protein